jgi:hypothetical protein
MCVAFNVCLVFGTFLLAAWGLSSSADGFDLLWALCELLVLYILHNFHLPVNFSIKRDLLS